ncbi:hypothetical protein B296_00012126 [Ensete ventricosum]|uniref:Uncharacterized protein n=1 Tax=Ensete ventricosum TaxID=4639 RepID=A0A427ACE6_ENSVE|nr:hypothetical protein B296_00012126 [Ensete ventricosum]
MALAISSSDALHPTRKHIEVNHRGDVAPVIDAPACSLPLFKQHPDLAIEFRETYFDRPICINLEFLLYLGPPLVMPIRCCPCISLTMPRKKYGPTHLVVVVLSPFYSCDIY